VHLGVSRHLVAVDMEAQRSDLGRRHGGIGGQLDHRAGAVSIDDSPLDHVLKLPDVSGPAVPLEPLGVHQRESRLRPPKREHHVASHSVPIPCRSRPGIALGVNHSLPAKVREEMPLVVAQANVYDYCVAAHSAVGRMTGLAADQNRDSRLGAAVYAP
jgi:AhpD family alkylhydroperoxidase